jgi:uncharacterized protein (DUF2147 family)
MRLLHQSLPFALCALLGTTNLYAASTTVRGYWREPSGGVIRIAPCGTSLCMDIVALSPQPHPSSDVRNPDRRLRERPLCGLRIGAGFIERDSRHADGGHLYDPKSGHTYRGSMSSDGDLLELRGYVGLKLFGRTETWMRVYDAPGPCRTK